MSFQLHDDEIVTFKVTGTDAAGNPAPFTGTPAFAVDDASILTLVDNGDGSGSVQSTGKLGTGVLSVADNETSGTAISGSVSIDVLADGVVAANIALDEPTKIPAATPAPDAPSA